MLNHLVRYVPVIDIVRRSGARTLLEVGSGSRGIGRYLDDGYDITACDVDFDDYGSADPGAAGRVRRVSASVLDLPFEAGAFDLVVALDLLEHLQPGDRPRAVAELTRVAGTAVVGCPTGPAALRADRRLAGYIRRTRRRRPAWLQEHLEHGFPDAQDLAAWMGPGATLIDNERATTHALICALEATPGLWRVPLRLGEVLAARLGSRPARGVLWVLRGGDRPPAYRTIAVLGDDGLRSAAAPPPRA